MVDTKEPRDAALYLRVSQGELERLDAMVERFPFLSRSGLAREAMRLGLEQIRRDGVAALGRTAVPAKKGRAKR